MRPVSRTEIRLLFIALVTASALVLGAGYATDSAASTTAEIREQAELAADERTQVVAPRDGITVVSTDSNAWLGAKSDGPRAVAELVAFDPDGTVRYYNDSHTRYWDVDPSPLGRATVLYTAADHLNESECRATTVCTRNVVERVNLTTGQVTRLFSRVTPYKHSTRWHDADRVDDEHVVVADIYRDRVFEVNTTSGIVTWSWNAQNEFDLGSGGEFPRDWTHINNVQMLEDGRIAVSVRNQDQVVFLDPERGVDRNWTLGADDDHDVLYEQHNPDYISAADGGPAVLVADSENDRVVEYQRTGDGWTRTWTWQDARMQWPRDADRLPNGHTLVTDSNGDRVFEVNRSGAVVWSVDVAFPYEAERLGTGDESAGGPSARAANLTSRTVAGDGGTSVDDGTATAAGPLDRAWVRVKSLVPGQFVNGVLYTVPTWMGGREVAALLALVVTSLVWAGAEWRWSGLDVELRLPFVVRRRR